jgi:hypothetical protein
MLMGMEMCIFIARAEAAAIYDNKRIKFQEENQTDVTQYY